MKNPTQEQVYDWLLNYSKNKRIHLKLTRQYHNQIKSAGITSYEEQTSNSLEMSDPTYAAVTKRLKLETLLNRLDHKIKYIDNRMNKINDEELAIVFALLVTDCTVSEISAILDQNNSVIYNKIRKISRVIHS